MTAGGWSPAARTSRRSSGRCGSTPVARWPEWRRPSRRPASPTYPPGGVPRTVGGEVSDGAADLASRTDVADVVAYPALVDEGGTVGIRVFTSPADQARAMRAGTRRLLVLGAGTVRKSLQSVLGSGSWSNRPGRPGSVAALNRDEVMWLATVRGRVATSLLDDAMTAAADALLDWAGGPAWTPHGVRGVAAQDLRPTGAGHAGRPAGGRGLPARGRRRHGGRRWARHRARATRPPWPTCAPNFLDGCAPDS